MTLSPGSPAHAGPFGHPWPPGFRSHGNCAAQQLSRLLPLGASASRGHPGSCWCLNTAPSLGRCLSALYTQPVPPQGECTWSRSSKVKPRSRPHPAPRITPSLQIPGSVAELDSILEMHRLRRPPLPRVPASLVWSLTLTFALGNFLFSTHSPCCSGRAHSSPWCREWPCDQDRPVRLLIPISHRD